MPLFQIDNGNLQRVEQENFSLEKELQRLVENNLEGIFNCRFVASEFSTAARHAGRIDTLGLSEDNNPVIVEYKKVESSALINQSLFYLNWIRDHKGDFEIAVQKALGSDAVVDWSAVRVICIAPNFRKYDLFAVQEMGSSIELWSYRLFKNNSLYLEEISRRSLSSGSATSEGEVSVSNESPAYTFDGHIEGKPQDIQDSAIAIQEFALGLDPAMEEIPRKLYVAYKLSQNILCMEVQQQKLLAWVKLDPKSIESMPSNARDVSQSGHYGTGDLEFTIRTPEDFEVAKGFIEKAYRRFA
jgi:predicted transport protein